MTSSCLKDSLEAFVAAILEVVERGRRDGSLKPSAQVYFRWRLEGELKHNERGVELPSARGETSTRSSWAIATALVAQQMVAQTPECQAVIVALRDIPEIAAHADQYLHIFAFAVGRRALESEQSLPADAFEDLVKRFLDDIEGRPFDCGAELKLEGLALESETVEPIPGIVLRRPKREDFEQEIPYFGPGPGMSSFVGPISAVATIKRKGTGPQDAQRTAEKLIALLRLFKVASVRYLSYDLFGESLIHFVGGRVTSGARESVHELGFIRSEDGLRLTRFCHTLDAIIPDSFYDTGARAWDYRHMAYERYSAALMNPGSFEERVANGIMSLEALFLEERQELSYRLRLRTAKVLSFLDEKSIAVRDALTDAYDVRSAFAHGARLSSRENRKLELRYESLGGLVGRTLSFVRKAILASLLVRRTKEEFIDLVDDALIERSADDQLRQLLLPVAELA